MGDRDINLANPYVNTACLPSCDNQFDHIFANGTGVRCHVAGWGKDEIDGTFQFIPKKVDLSLVSDNQCEAKLKTALNSRQPGVGDRFVLHPSEVCAGGEVGKDACVGDGGSPLVFRPSLADGPWWGWSPGASGAPLTSPGCMSRCRNTGTGSTPTENIQTEIILLCRLAMESKS